MRCPALSLLTSESGSFFTQQAAVVWETMMVDSSPSRSNMVVEA